MIELYLLFSFVHVYSMAFVIHSKDRFVFTSPTHLNILLENLDMHINSLAGNKNAYWKYE